MNSKDIIPIHRAFMPENIMEDLESTLHSGFLAYGEYTNKFQEGVSTYIGNEYFLSLSSNSVYFALDVLGIEKEDEIISSPMSCLMTNQPMAMKQATAVWCDIDPFTGTLNPEDLKIKITSKTKAIIHYHWGGNPGHIDEINKIAKEYGIPVIEEASMAFGSEYKGKKIGNTNSDIVCFSFTAVRLPNAINGYGIAFNNKEMYDKAILKRDFGIDRKIFRDHKGEISRDCDVQIPALGSMLDNISSYVGYKQLKSVDANLIKQRQNAEQWDAIIGKIDGTRKINTGRETNPNYWVYSIISNKRDELYDHFSKKGLSVTKLHLRNDLYSVFGQSNNISELKGVDAFEKTQLNLPCGWWIENNLIK